jgi:hypothetical protein
MGTLKDFREYLDGRRAVLGRAEKTLVALQEKYETFFGEVARVRESELGQLRELLRAGAGVPADLRGEVERATAEQARRFDEKLAEIERQWSASQAKAEKVRCDSLSAEQQVRQANTTLDREEESLKTRSERLLAEIERHNAGIRELGRGFGFFWNLFRMRGVQTERRRLDREQADVVARIEALRLKWQEREREYVEREAQRKEEWVAARTEAATLASKAEHLKTARERLVERGALEKVLFGRAPELPAPTAADPACPRCGQRNASAAHFCRICAQRLAGDRSDLAGSLAEIAEVNWHHERFAEGVRACQEIIGLVRGLNTGVVNFSRSVNDMLESQTQHSLARLEIDVPAASVAYGKSFDELLALVEKTDPSLHPLEFAGEIQKLVAQTFTEPRIKGFFEAMGSELSRQAKRQW